MLSICKTHVHPEVVRAALLQVVVVIKEFRNSIVASSDFKENSQSTFSLKSPDSKQNVGHIFSDTEQQQGRNLEVARL